MPEAASSSTERPGKTRPVLAATDFSSDSMAALLWAGRYAALSEAPLCVLHVVHDPADAAGFYRSGEDQPVKPMADVAAEMVGAFLSAARDANPDLKILDDAQPIIVIGLPPGRIVEVAKREGAQLIVIGSRGLTGLSHILVGSVAERVTQLAPMPVVIVKRPAEEAGS